MRRQKRDKTSTLFNRGFQAGLEGKSMSSCPVSETDMRSHWMSGWREGRDAHWSGQSGVSAIQANPSFH
ncbi:ribosome modulation factor [Marinobacterium nitratireducens]|uniref:ribosome modulation factor n=1 Tax=Marinobacterium nitratireducens TaxID=518897 RepID=UPI00166D634D|nr:ribosome modulation factor [Marinobacterium nitratireducens]